MLEIYSRVQPNNNSYNTVTNKVNQFSSINFGYRSKLKEESKHCAYCGVNVLTWNSLEQLSEKLAKAKGKKLVGMLGGLIKRFDKQSKFVAKSKIEVRKKFLQDLVKISKQHPEYSGEEVIKSFKKKHKKPTLAYDEYFLKRIHREPITVIHYILHPLISTVDHFEPKSYGGRDSNYNYLVSCMSCNRSRGNKDFKVWAKEHPKVFKNIIKYLEEVMSKNDKRGNYILSIVSRIGRKVEKAEEDTIS